MSADNRICVQERDGKWYTWMALGDGPWKPGSNAKVFATEMEAHMEAIRMYSEEIVEYGICVLPAKEAK